jgi:S1-C subfamily serine protease
MIRKYLFTCTVLILTVFPYISSAAQAAQIEVAGKHMRSDGSVYDFEVIDGDALSPGDRFQIIIDTDKNTFYSILYFSRDGKAAQIFPQAGQRGLIRAGARQYIPGADNYFTLDVNGGRELMFVVTSPNELSNLKSVLRGAESVSSPIEINAYLQKRLPRVQKLEITNTGKRIASSTDQVSSSLVRDIERTYAKNPWPDTSASDENNRSRVRRGDDNSIPEAVRRRTAEVRSLLKTQRGRTGSSSLRTVQATPSQTIGTPAGGEIRRDTAKLMAQKEKQAEEARLRQERLEKEDRLRQQQIAVAKQEREAAEAKAKKLQEEREVAERLEAQRIAEEEAVARELELKRQAIVRSEAEARLQVELPEEPEHVAEQAATGKAREYEGEIRRDMAMLMAQKEKQAEEARLRQERLGKEERLRQQQIAVAKQEREAAEAKAKKLQEEREVAERLEAQRIAEAEAVARELELKRQAIVKSEAEARLQAELREEQERLAEQAATQTTRKYEVERLAAVEAKRLETERQALAAEEAKRLETERQALAETEALAQSIEKERLLAEQQRMEKKRAEVKARELAEQHAAEESERLAAETRRQAEIAAEEESIRAEQEALEEKLRLAAERLRAEEAKHLETERQALAETEALALRMEEKRLLAEQQRMEKERAETKARELAEQHAAEESERLAAETRRQAEIAAEEESIRAEQEALEEKLRLAKEQEALEEKLRLAEEENSARDEEGDKGIFGQMLALVSGDDAEETKEDTATVVVETDSTGEVILNEPVAESQIEFTNSAVTAPREAVVVLQAPLRPVEKKMSAPAPVRITLEDGKSMDKAAAGDMAAQIASAIVSISTSNDPQASGFILDSKGHILTAWHVINGVTDINVSFMAISGAPRVFKARVVKYDKFHDLALLQLVNPPEGLQPIAVSGDELPDAGSTVRVFGQKDGQIWATDDAVITRIAEHFTWFSQDNVIHRGEVLQIDLPPEGKDIGSLVTTMDYQLLGVKSFSGSQTGRTYAVSVRMIRDFVEARGVAASKSATPSR